MQKRRRYFARTQRVPSGLVVNGVFLPQAYAVWLPSPALVAGWFSRQCGTDLVGVAAWIRAALRDAVKRLTSYPGFHPGLLSNAPTGLAEFWGTASLTPRRGTNILCAYGAARG